MAIERTNHEAAIREIFEQWAAAVRTEDIDGIRANHSPDILMFDVPPPLYCRGLDAYMETWQLFYKSQVRPVAFNFDDVEITVSQDVAFVTAMRPLRLYSARRRSDQAAIPPHHGAS